MGERIKSAREKACLTQREVAEAVGISERQYQYYEQYKRIPNAITAVKLAKALKTTVETLYHG